jgi:hypothetical protein
VPNYFILLPAELRLRTTNSEAYDIITLLSARPEEYHPIGSFIGPCPFDAPLFSDNTIS